MKKLPFIFTFLCVAHLAFGKENTTYTPETYSEQRYEHIWSRKPFSPSSMLQPVDKQYVLTGFLKMGDQWTAFIQDRKTQQRQSVSATPNETGLQWVSIKEGDVEQASTVVVRSGQQISTIGFDPGTGPKAADPSSKTLVAQNSPGVKVYPASSLAHKDGAQQASTVVVQPSQKIITIGAGSVTESKSEPSKTVFAQNPFVAEPVLPTANKNDDTAQQASTISVQSDQQITTIDSDPTAEPKTNLSPIEQSPSIVKPALPANEDDIQQASTEVIRPAEQTTTISSHPALESKPAPTISIGALKPSSPVTQNFYHL